MGAPFFDALSADSAVKGSDLYQGLELDAPSADCADSADSADNAVKGSEAKNFFGHLFSTQ